MNRAHSSISVRGFQKRHVAPSESCFFPVDNKLHSRDDVSRHCEGFQRATTSFHPPEPNPALVVKTCCSSVPSGMSPAASDPWCLDGAIAAVFHLNVWKWGRRMQGEWLRMQTEVEKKWATVRATWSKQHHYDSFSSGHVNWIQSLCADGCYGCCCSV